ncbi:hypothetical protein CRYUN_Cryun05aG0045400 [Craigia yunnanensis]
MVEDTSNGQLVGHVKIHMPSIERMTDDKMDLKSRWFNLVGGENKPYAGRIHLVKAPIGLLEVGIRGASNLLPVKTKDGARRTTDAYVVAKYGPNVAKKIGEIEIAVRFSCSSWLSLIQAYGTPMLLRMHYICLLGPAQQDILRHTAMRIVMARLARSEPLLGQEVVQFMLDSDTHVWSMRRSKANWFRVVRCLSHAATLARWLDGIRTWAHPPTTILVHLLLAIVVLCPHLVLPTVSMYAFLILALRFRYRLRVPHNVDLRLSYVDAVDLDELDEEFDGFPTTQSPDTIRIRYDHLRALTGQAQTLLGDVAAQRERLEPCLIGRTQQPLAFLWCFVYLLHCYFMWYHSRCLC